MAKQIYFAWVGYQRRIESINRFVDFKTYYIAPPFQPRWLKPLGYIQQMARMILILLKEKPDLVWYQAPPTFLGHILLAMRFVTRRQFRIIADCHNASFRLWGAFPGHVPALHSVDLILTHNVEVVEQARRLGVKTRITVLEDPPASIDGCLSRDRPAAEFALVPCSFHADEPIDILIATAAKMPEMIFKVTGNRRKAISLGYVAKAPPNMHFTDYLPISEFNDLLRNCSVLVGLTVLEGIQLSVANEGVGAGKAMVLSDTAILRDLFGSAAIMAKNEPEALSAAILEAWRRREELEIRMRAFAHERLENWKAELAPVLQMLDLTEGTTDVG